MSPASSYNSPAGVARFFRCISARYGRETDVCTLYFHRAWYIGYRRLNPQSTLNNVGLVARPQHSPCPCYTHVLVRCWRVGTTDFRRNSQAHLLEQQSQLCQPVSQALQLKIRTTTRCVLFVLVMSQLHAVATLSYSQPSMTKYHR